VTPRRRAAWVGAILLGVLVVLVPAWRLLSRTPRYEGAPAVLAANEAAAVRRVVAAASRGAPETEREEAGYRLRSDGPHAYAWPVTHGITGIRTYVADREGRVAWTEDARYAGPGRGPAPRAALSPGASALARVQRGEDGNEWRLLHE
jgi:hypothetical protein